MENLTTILKEKPHINMFKEKTIKKPPWNCYYPILSWYHGIWDIKAIFIKLMVTKLNVCLNQEIKDIRKNGQKWRSVEI